MIRLHSPRAWSRRVICVASVLWMALSSTHVCGAQFLVEDGRSRAEIIISEQPPRTVKLAANELQNYVKKITGALVPIKTAPSDAQTLQIYVGRSPHTDRLKVSDEGLKYGAFRMESGPNYLILLGQDRDFVLPKFYLSTPSDMPQLLKEWDAATGEQWGFATGNLYKEYHSELKIWNRDEHGSLNAVYEFLRLHGVRWYLPIKYLTKMKMIALKVSEIRLPNFKNSYSSKKFRAFNINQKNQKCSRKQLIKK